MLDQDNNLYLISLIILMTCLQDNVWISEGKVTCLSILGFKGLKAFLASLISPLYNYFLKCVSKTVGELSSAKLHSWLKFHTIALASR